MHHFGRALSRQAARNPDEMGISRIFPKYGAALALGTGLSYFVWVFNGSSPLGMTRRDTERDMADKWQAIADAGKALRAFHKMIPPETREAFAEIGRANREAAADDDPAAEAPVATFTPRSGIGALAPQRATLAGQGKVLPVGSIGTAAGIAAASAVSQQVRPAIGSAIATATQAAIGATFAPARGTAIATATQAGTGATFVYAAGTATATATAAGISAPKKVSEAALRECLRGIVKDHPPGRRPLSEKKLHAELERRLEAPVERNRVRNARKVYAPQWVNPRGRPRKSAQ
jgi:hypothetical protein